MGEEQKCLYLTWKVVLGVALRNLKFLKIVEWLVIKPYLQSELDFVVCIIALLLIYGEDIDTESVRICKNM